MKKHCFIFIMLNEQHFLCKLPHNSISLHLLKKQNQIIKISYLCPWTAVLTLLRSCWILKISCWAIKVSGCSAINVATWWRATLYRTGHHTSRTWPTEAHNITNRERILSFLTFLLQLMQLKSAGNKKKRS